MHRNVLGAALVISLGWVGTAEAGGGIELGFITGQRNYEAARFSRTEGDTSPSLISAFKGAPFDGVAIAGVGFETNITIDGVRVSIGYAQPYIQFSGPIVTHDPVTAVTSTAQVRSMTASETLFGLGYQLALKKSRLSLDLIGTAEKISTDIAIGDRQGTYEATGFGFSLRAGIRHPFHKAFYFHASGEAGLSGSKTMNAFVGVGAGVP